MSTLLDHEPGLAEPIEARVTEFDLIVLLSDGRRISTPLAWYPSLLAASQSQRDHFELSPFGIHWPEIDEDLNVAGMLNGETAQVHEVNQSA